MQGYDTRESDALLGETDPELAEFLNKTQTPPINIATMMSKLPPPPELSDTESEYNIEIPMRDGHRSKARIYRPSPAPTKSPLVVLIYGGGFIGGDFTQLSFLSRSAAALYNATVINFSHRLAPQHKFPTAPQDVWDNLSWIVKDYQSFNADPSAGFILGGASAGGNLAAVTAQKMLDENISPPLTGLWLTMLYLLESSIVPPRYQVLWFSREQNKDAMIINHEAMEYILNAYEPDVRSPDFSPFNSTKKTPHTGMPPVNIDVCGHDHLRDDGLIYERALRQARTKTRLRVYPGVPHGFSMLAAFGAKLKAVDRSHVEGSRGLVWLLGREEERGLSEDVILRAFAAGVEV